jgi:ubiquinone/menaquinone biosynthesis C-methylase UbiE
VADRQFEDSALAALYDSFCGTAERDDFRFYLPLIMQTEAVLDVGCGTGALLSLARAAGHAGRLCGTDPAFGMLEQARRHAGITWTRCDATTTPFHHMFGLAVMTGHTFQTLVTDDEIDESLYAIRRALAPGGRFAFETRNPLAREWEQWTPEQAVERIDAAGHRVRMSHEVREPVRGNTVTFTTTFASDAWDAPRTSTSTLRFLEQDELVARLIAADFAIEDQTGDWGGSPVRVGSPEIITVARRRE